MSTVKKIGGQTVVSTIDSHRLGTELLHCFLPGEKLPKNSSSKLKVIDIIIKATRELKNAGIKDVTVENYARYFRLSNNQTLVKNALLFCTSDTEGLRQLNEILNPGMKATA